MSYLFGLLALAAFVVPSIHPLVLEPLGLKPESSLYRLPILVAVLGLPFFLRLMALNSWQAAGFTLTGRQSWAALGKGWLVGIGNMTVLAVMLWLLGAYLRKLSRADKRQNSGFLFGYSMVDVPPDLGDSQVGDTIRSGIDPAECQRCVGCKPLWPITMHGDRVSPNALGMVIFLLMPDGYRTDQQALARAALLTARRIR